MQLKHSETIVSDSNPKGSLKTKLLTYDELALELDVTKQTLYRWVKNGVIKVIRKGRRFSRFDRDDVVKRLANYKEPKRVSRQD